MQEPHKKGLANHLGPQSCADGGEVEGEALEREHAGQPLSSEKTKTGRESLRFAPVASGPPRENKRGSVVGRLFWNRLPTPFCFSGGFRQPGAFLKS